MNLEPINLWAWGAGDPNYPDGSFYAYGLYAGIDLINSGAVDVNTIGGTLNVPAGAYTSISEAGGLYGAGDVDNTGAIAVPAAAGTADANDGSAYAFVADAYGIYAHGDANNTGTIVVNVTAGVADTDNGNSAFATC